MKKRIHRSKSASAKAAAGRAKVAPLRPASPPVDSTPLLRAAEIGTLSALGKLANEDIARSGYFMVILTILTTAIAIVSLLIANAQLEAAKKSGGDLQHIQPMRELPPSTCFPGNERVIHLA